ncbi:SERPIN domain-containing protein [Podarcis lilfordi]|uniref:SERPIN domain-containing protein n=1 Tax=Podarcis lilfordi TaxID=74358 RepID=A0AA35JSI4_9SAUR|nr:SERPIN domain-containing protein [Podarcis lilfordi]
MKPTILLSLLLIVLQVHNGYGGKDSVQERLVSSIDGFALKFFRRIASLQGGKNIFFSPMSISMAFSMIGMGAKQNTEKQIYKGLGLEKIDTSMIHKGFQEFLKVLTSSNHQGMVNMGNGLYLAKGIKIATRYNKDLQSFYKSEIFAVNFKDNVVAEKQINNFVKANTKGKIREVVRGLDPNTVMVLVNYIYFKDEWENPFVPKNTGKGDFFVDAKTTVKVNMMKKTDYFRHVRDESLSCWVIELPYKGGAVAWFILPDKGKLEKVEDGLKGETLSKWRKSLETGTQFYLAIPKLSMATSYDLKDLLPGLGISEVFTPNADLTGITGGGKVKIDKASHKAVLDINESGTEAAAATFMSFGVGAAPGPPPVHLVFDRPYFFFLMASVDGPMLFMGKTVNPAHP